MFLKHLVFLIPFSEELGRFLSGDPQFLLAVWHQFVERVGPILCSASKNIVRIIWYCNGVLPVRMVHPRQYAQSPDDYNALPPTAVESNGGVAKPEGVRS